MRRIICGIDPGLSGALSALLVADGKLVFLSVIDAPISSDGSKRQINVDRLACWIERWEPTEVIMENVQPMPSIPGVGGQRRTMGTASSFRFGIAVGQLRAAFQCYRIPITLVMPGAWKAHFGLKGQAREEGRQLAIRRLPEASQFLARKLDHNRSDAILLALYQADRQGLIL